MAEKRYYWLKLQDDYFTSPKIKKLRKIAGGDTLTIIYLKMQLMSVHTNGTIAFEGIEETIEDELALKLDEDADSIRLLMGFLRSCGLIVEIGGDTYSLPEVMKNIGDESTSAERMRKMRAKQKQLSQCDAGVTQVTSRCDEKVTLEKEIEKDKEIYTPLDTNVSIPPRGECVSKKFIPPTVDEVRSYCKERGNRVDAQAFVDHYAANGWFRGKTKIKDWRACVRTWEHDNRQVTSASEEFIRGDRPLDDVKIDENESLRAWKNLRI